MSEELLKALMKLFAMASDVDDINQQSRVIVKNYLTSELSSRLVDTYLEIYDNYVDQYHGENRTGEDLSKESIQKASTQINGTLEQKQKVVIVIRLLEYIFADENISEYEKNFLITVADTFNIPGEEYDVILNFIEPEKIPNSETILIIGKEDSQIAGNSNNKFIDSANLNGRMVIVRIPSVDMYAMHYMGDDELYLNGQIIHAGRSYILTSGSSIRSAKVQPIYFSDIVSTFMNTGKADKVVFKATDLTYRFSAGNIGLHPFQMAEESGKLLGIMGGSGAGKSTLLNVLNGNYTPQEGSVTINGVDIHKESQKIKGLIGYVSQDDLLIEELTVFQNLYYNTKLIFGNKSKEEVTEMVYSLLTSLGLRETADLKVGSPLNKFISGGQRKRLNIALELIREPAVLFVDEPTSGLSSRDSQNIMDLLKELSLKGKLIFVVIHQPSSDIFKMFDKLMILDVGGYPVYYGNPVDGITYFKKLAHYANAEEEDLSGTVNPEIIFNIIDAKVVDEYGNLTEDRKVSPLEWYQHFNEHLNKPEKVASVNEVPESGFKLANVFAQFKIFTTRDVLSKLTNKQYLLINLLEAPVLALILSYFVRYFPFAGTDDPTYSFYDNENIPAYIFMAVVVSLFIGLTVSAEEIIRDQKIRKRESFLNLSRSSYLFSKITIMFVLSAIQTITFILVGNNILHIEDMTFNYWIVLFSTACFANALGLNISSAFNSAVTIYILIPFLIIPQLIFSGVIVKFDKLNPTISSKTTVPFIGEVMASKWAFEAIAVNQFIENRFEKPLYYFDKEMATSNFKKVYWIPDLVGKVGFVENNMGDEVMESEVADVLTTLKNEIVQQDKKHPKLAYPFVDKLNTENIDQQAINELRKYFEIQKAFYTRLYQRTSSDRDQIVSNFEQHNSGGGSFMDLKSKYRNQALSDLVTNRMEPKHIVEIDNQLVQQENPIYLDSETFRSHFFAPTKVVFGKRMETFWVNIGVIWFMTLSLIVLLFFNAFRRVVELF